MPICQLPQKHTAALTPQALALAGMGLLIIGMILLRTS